MMCEITWYEYECGHVKPADGNQVGWTHCARWTERQNERQCPNFDASTIRVEMVAKKCTQCG